MVVYFCHHLSDNYVDMLDLYVDLSVMFVDLSDHDVNLSENKKCFRNIYAPHDAKFRVIFSEEAKTVQSN